jgi:hypothetical protein
MRFEPAGAPVRSGTGLRAALRSRSRVARSARAIARWSGLMAALALAIFHIFLFWDRLVGGDLFDPAIALRWLAAAGLVSALAALRRMGVSLASGRKAFVIWLLVVLLHASGRSVPVVAPGDSLAEIDASAIFILPSALTLVGLGLLGATVAWRRLTAFAVIGRTELGAVCRLSAGWRRGGATRAPPIAAF